MTLVTEQIDLASEDGARWQLQLIRSTQARATLLWLPALGVAAKHYRPFADALAGQGIAVAVHEWRGLGSSNLRAGRDADWGYRELLTRDLPVSQAALQTRVPTARPLIGGHSLGGQLAALRLALAPEQAQGLVLVACGAPYWRTFPLPLRWLLPPLYRFLPWLAERRGHLPGHALGFAGREARRLIRDWARTGLSGRYAVADLDEDFEAALSSANAPVYAARFPRDRLCPLASLDFLLGKLPAARKTIEAFDASRLGTRADHFSWMRRPAAVASGIAAWV